ncbi:MAG: hypothetical protein J6Z36_02025 [Clostridia bacterium]|nr:hypothetical protein [Clostridia bacterium]
MTVATVLAATPSERRGRENFASAEIPFHRAFKRKTSRFPRAAVTHVRLLLY